MPFPKYAAWNSAESLREGRFTFLNDTRELGNPVDWTAPGAPLLWRFNLHYFDSLHLLGQPDAVALARSWVKANPPGRGVAWHPYPTSLRITNWCKYGLHEPDLLKSLFSQAGYLARNLETYVYGNHLLENARALVLAGLYFDGAGESSAWFERGLRNVMRELDEQVLPDGGHYERSPMYHALMTALLLDVMNVLPDERPERAAIERRLTGMLAVLAAYTHPDGHLALLKDSTQEIAMLPADLQVYADALLGTPIVSEDALPDTGYYVHRKDEVYLIIDAGRIGPSHLMAHAHADIFSYELSLFGRQFVVDAGVYEYQGGEMRDYVRSTGAHNTVTVDGRDQMECWGSFRVARRYRVSKVAVQTEDGVFLFDGLFEGYARLLGDEIVHRRTLQISEAEHMISVRDEISGVGRHRIESRIHLHPDVHVVQEGNFLLLKHQDRTCRLVCGDARYRIEDAWYCPRFGTRVRNKVVVVGGDYSLPKVLAYSIRYR